MHNLFLVLVVFNYFVCNAQKNNAEEYADTIDENELKEMLYVYASDYFGGRETGERGQKIAVDFLKDYYINQEIESASGTEGYFQKMQLTIKKKRS